MTLWLILLPMVIVEIVLFLQVYANMNLAPEMCRSIRMRSSERDGRVGKYVSYAFGCTVRELRTNKSKSTAVSKYGMMSILKSRSFKTVLLTVPTLVPIKEEMDQ